MRQNRESRIEHYCNKLGLNRWDKKDIQSFFYYAEIIQKEEDKGNYSFSGFRDEKEKLDKYAYRVTAVGLYEIKSRFAEYLKAEKRIFSSYKSDNPEMNDNEIWENVYQTVDEIIEEDIDHAKAIAKERHGNMGCLSILLLMTFISVTSFIFIISVFN